LSEASLDEGTRFPICNPDALRDLFARNGFIDIEVVEKEKIAEYGNFGDTIIAGR
jgi:hypothetical protein